MNLIIELVFRNWVHKGQLCIIDKRGRASFFGNVSGWPKVTIRLHDDKLLFQFLGDFVLALGEAYMDQRFTIEQGTLYDLLELLAINYRDAEPTWFEKVQEFLAPILKKIQQYNPLGRAKQNVAHHYDLSSKLYKLFLDKDMQYSCGYFRNPNDDLETAQLEKKRHIAAKLLLRPGMRVLDIGCGWGGMALFLAKNYGVSVVGLTLSEEQFKIANERAEREGLSHKVKFYLRDYREETGEYDRIVSVGMFEHVGVNHYPEFFAKTKNLLKRDGIMLLHAIGRMEKPGVTNQWIQKYIFPGAYSPALSEVFSAIEHKGMWATDMEILRIHYAETLRHWWLRFNENRAEIANIYDERFCRMWEFYMRGCEVHFRHISLMVFQIQLAKNIDAVPIVRNYMLEPATQSEPAPVNQLIGTITGLPTKFHFDQMPNKIVRK